MPESVRNFLEVKSLVTGYGKKQVVNGVSISIALGEIAALIGHNGAGKSTLLKAIFGIIPIWQGRLAINGEPLHHHIPAELIRVGVVYTPQGNRVFRTLTVREHLEVGIITHHGRRARGDEVERVLAFFPSLKPRLNQKAGTLSGGEKQMLTLASSLILSPRLLLLDEPSLGLSPPLVIETLKRIQKVSQNSGAAILIVEQKVREVLTIAQSVYVLRNGLVSFSGPVTELNNDDTLRAAYL